VEGDTLLRVEGITSTYAANAKAVLFHGDAQVLIEQIPMGEVQLYVTSPPYNIGKSYERKMSLDRYLAEQERVIKACAARLSQSGSICWQVGNHVQNNVAAPLDILLYPIFAKHGLVLRNRIIWHFEHGLHCTRRLSGRHEAILWFTRPGNEYTFNLDPIRVPQKYPGKRHFKGPRAGQFSGNPLGKNPGDVWAIPNVKHNHVEKTIHPCQFPVELVERLILALTDEGDLVVDPFMGVGTSCAAAIMHGRRSAGADIVEKYVRVARARVEKAALGSLRVRSRHRPVYQPKGSVAISPWAKGAEADQLRVPLPF
jgi:adenine-specific DNA-methyltransferase